MSLEGAALRLGRGRRTERDLVATAPAAFDVVTVRQLQLLFAGSSASIDFSARERFRVKETLLPAATGFGPL
jgi:hypothetical protein